jgi:hypothetical protein
VFGEECWWSWANRQPGVIIVAAVNLEQLRHSIRSSKLFARPTSYVVLAPLRRFHLWFARLTALMHGLYKKWTTHKLTSVGLLVSFTVRLILSYKSYRTVNNNCNHVHLIYGHLISPNSGDQGTELSSLLD